MCLTQIYRLSCQERNKNRVNGLSLIPFVCVSCVCMNANIHVMLSCCVEQDQSVCWDAPHPSFRCCLRWQACFIERLSHSVSVKCLACVYFLTRRCVCCILRFFQCVWSSLMESRKHRERPDRVISPHGFFSFRWNVNRLEPLQHKSSEQGILGNQECFP